MEGDWAPWANMGPTWPHLWYQDAEKGQRLEDSVHLAHGPNSIGVHVNLAVMVHDGP